MNFGLLCDDPAAAPLLSALQEHALTRAVLVSPLVDGLLHGIVGVRCTDRWEDLLTTDDIEAVIVGGTVPAVWEGARQLASEGIPLLVFPTVFEGAAILYELSLIRDDRRGVLFPAWPHRFDSSILAWRARFRDGNESSRMYLHWEREVSLGEGREIPNRQIEELLLRDADLWRFLFGTADRVTALRTGGTPTGALLQSVVLTGQHVPESTWAVKSSAADVSRITLQTADGPRRLVWDAATARWLQSESNSVAANPAVGDGGSNARLLEAFVRAVRGEPAEAEWTDVLHAAEIVDAAQRSLERRRTIELHHEALSERAIFKTQMAAMGCGVLMLTLLLMFGYLAVASVVPLGGRVLTWLRLAVFSPLFLFLLLQFLLPLTRTTGQSAK